MLSQIISLSFLLFIIMLTAWIFFQWLSYRQREDAHERSQFVADRLSEVGKQIWGFGAPILHAALVLVIALALLIF
jgi:hypothetical protein